MWLYVPDCSPSAPESAESISDSVTLSTLAQSVTWRGSSKPAPFYARAWKRANWMRLLFGVTQEPLTVALGVTRWILSAGGSLANLSASRESVAAQTMNDGYGQLFVTSSRPAARPLRFSKTSRGLSLPGLETSSGIYPRSGLMRHGVVSELPRSARRIAAIGGSSSDIDPARTWRSSSEWWTPRSRDWKGNGKDCLDRQARGFVRESLSLPHLPVTGPESFILNPPFVEALMGYRDGWTDCGYWETPSSPRKPHSRGGHSMSGS